MLLRLKCITTKVIGCILIVTFSFVGFSGCGEDDIEGRNIVEKIRNTSPPLSWSQGKKFIFDSASGNCKDSAELPGLNSGFNSERDGECSSLYQANLKNKELIRVNLRGAVLAWADLSGSDLTDAVLEGSDLSHANLSNAILTGADLRGASLQGARLIGVSLKQVILSEANFAGADLSSAELSEPDDIDSLSSQIEIDGAVCSSLTALPNGWTCVNGRFSQFK